MKTKNEYIESAASELKLWGAQIDLLNAKAESAAVDMKHKYHEELAILRTRQKAANEKIIELQEHSGESWESIKESADKLWGEFRTGLTNATSKFK
jgi:hypothetical protein